MKNRGDQLLPKTQNRGKVISHSGTLENSRRWDWITRDRIKKWEGYSHLDLGCDESSFLIFHLDRPGNDQADEHAS